VVVYVYVKFGHRGLDNLFEIEPGIVTAIVGKAGMGKTTLALALAKDAERPYLVDTEGISLERVKQVGATHIKIARVRNFEKQHELITSLKVDADLLIIDSLVLLYRLKLMEDYKEANAMLSRQVFTLHRMADALNIPVVVTGHVYKTEEGNKIVGGDIMKYWAKALVFIDKTGPNRRKATLVKHRSRPEGASCKFRLCDKGVC
jgi:DNA repair protein RadB